MVTIAKRLVELIYKKYRLERSPADIIKKLYHDFMTDHARLLRKQYTVNKYFKKTI